MAARDTEIIANGLRRRGRKLQEGRDEKKKQTAGLRREGHEDD